MSMNGCYISVKPTDVEKLQANDEFVDQIIEESDSDALSIEKSWQAIHFLLNADPWKCTAGPLGNAVLGGRDVGEDMGYGPARFLTPEEVSATATALEAIDTEQFANRVTQADFRSADIYVFSEENPKDPDIVAELVGYYGEIRSLFRDAASKQHGMLLYIS